MKVMPNNNKSLKNGVVIQDNKYGEIKIIEKVDKFYERKGRKYYTFLLVRFNDGTEVIANTNTIRNRCVRNPNAPTVYGKGYIGQGTHRSKNNGKKTKEYTLWMSMMKRCYSEKLHKIHPTYTNCTVCERWLNYQNFCEDLNLIEGYDMWVMKPNIHLDKDIKVKGNKIYNLDSCKFVTPRENVQCARANNLIKE